MAENKFIIPIIIGIILIALVGTQTTLFSFFFTSMPSVNVVPNVVNDGETSSVRFSALLQEIGPYSGAYFHSVFINQKNICLNTAGTSNGDTYENQCPILPDKYISGIINPVEVFQAYERSQVVPHSMFRTYEGAKAFDDYRNKRDSSKLFFQCLYGTPNGESYDSSDQRWYQYPLNTEWERLGGQRPGDSGGGDCERGVRCSDCVNYLIIDGPYEKKSFTLTVFPNIIPTNTKIITLTMKNTGGQKLTDISLNQAGTTPQVLYSQFSNLNKFILNPNDQAIFYSNIDISSFNGQVPFQMMFNTKYSLDGGMTNLTLTKYTEPLILTFQNGVII